MLCYLLRNDFLSKSRLTTFRQADSKYVFLGVASHSSSHVRDEVDDLHVAPWGKHGVAQRNGEWTWVQGLYALRLNAIMGFSPVAPPQFLFLLRHPHLRRNIYLLDELAASGQWILCKLIHIRWTLPGRVPNLCKESVKREKVGQFHDLHPGSTSRPLIICRAILCT